MSQVQSPPKIVDEMAYLPQITLLTEKQWSFLQQRFCMTRRELQIAVLICRGYSNEEVADKLNIKAGTVKTHIRNIYRKAWVHSKIAMLLKFIESAQDLAPQERSVS